MQDFFVLLIFLLVVLVSCGEVANDVGAVANFEQICERREACEDEIAQYLQEFGHIEYASVQIDGGIAVVAISLAGEHNAKEVTNIKRDVIAEIKGNWDGIDHVAVTTTPLLNLTLFEY